ncbi:TerB family tellurite resistance protein [Mariprofundus erugo]|uniref:TerB family tellurite resistance protein n=1 Tax=Mariprofundus erugo TaxID=2528639 RepID=A0A5R9GZ82_9PROT|nr:TerB family tellurite resistance protein [Mariprofundus erugo]TLS69137.1 TerB family tellurite resistance protein [Mariprofundus erugo]TLS73998.1 TerB family tellurite resistance protein [Mariprofundus erugo]
MFFDLFRSRQSQASQLSRDRLQELVLHFLMQMAWLDGQPDERKKELLSKILVQVYRFDKETVHRKIDAFDPAHQDSHLALGALRALPVGERVQLLRDLWAVAIADGRAAEREQALFYRAAKLLDIEDNDFLEKCIKVKAEH